MQAVFFHYILVCFRPTSMNDSFQLFFNNNLPQFFHVIQLLSASSSSNNHKPPPKPFFRAIDTRSCSLYTKAPWTMNSIQFPSRTDFLLAKLRVKKPAAKRVNLWRVFHYEKYIQQTWRELKKGLRWFLPVSSELRTAVVEDNRRAHRNSKLSDKIHFVFKKTRNSLNTKNKELRFHTDGNYNKVWYWFLLKCPLTFKREREKRTGKDLNKIAIIRKKCGEKIASTVDYKVIAIRDKNEHVVIHTICVTGKHHAYIIWMGIG